MGMLLRRHYEENNNARKINNKVNGASNTVAPKPEKEVKETTVKAKAESEIDVDKIKSMSGTALRKYAESNGIENPEEYTVKELRALLLEQLSK